MAKLREVLEAHVGEGAVPGAVGLVARGGQVEVAVVGDVDVEGSAGMARDSIFRIASASKPVVAAAVMLLVQDGVLGLDEPVSRWLPELAEPVVVRTPASAVDDVVAVERPVTVFDVLTFRCGYGFPDDFSLPAVQMLFSESLQGPPEPQGMPGPDEWIAKLARVPMLSQPGDKWLYNTGSDIASVLVSRVAGVSLGEFLAERVFAPLGMVDTGFFVPEEKLSRFTSYYQPGENGLELLDRPDGQWKVPPPFESGAGGLVSTADDWLAFGRMLLGEGPALLTEESLRLMTSDHLTAAQREASTLFLEGQGWGFGGSVDVAATDPWTVPGRYGWVGGTGTAAHVVPSTGAVTVLMSQLAMTGPTPPTLMRDFWTYAATA
ncbi:serine hydrolase domain-containing protein [Umezawaea sp. NPDC059074]|uniref:serine hydrolase domain-containing protein n=1 Tax=Umezawaea sp. NPDC059074 TaxID=3346716 RepID=UPI0036A2ABF4